MKKIAFISILFTLFTVLAFSRPASRESFLITQPDGTTFRAFFRGDEFSRVLMTTDGCALMKDEDGFYQYAFYNADGTATRSGYKPGDNVPALVLNESRNIPYEAIRFKGELRRIELARRSKPRSLRTRAEGKASRHCLVILVQFPDLSFQNERTRKDEFTALVTERGYSKDGATGSVLDYFTDQLGHAYDFEFTVTDIVTASKSFKYYGEDLNGSGNDAHPDELAREACLLVDPFIDFSQYDDDGDGEVDNVYIIVAGCDEAEGGDADYIWPHQW
ncbi:MAG: immune inhibitor A, partial [Bacteroidales bacterium]|nr:immune inhibitor A [Candidatus Cryptobacteroides faecihippi]